jgi:hypothetical protein
MSDELKVKDKAQPVLLEDGDTCPAGEGED